MGVAAWVAHCLVVVRVNSLLPQYQEVRSLSLRNLCQHLRNKEGRGCFFTLDMDGSVCAQCVRTSQDSLCSAGTSGMLFKESGILAKV